MLCFDQQKEGCSAAESLKPGTVQCRPLAYSHLENWELPDENNLLIFEFSFLFFYKRKLRKYKPGISILECTCLIHLNEILIKIGFDMSEKGEEPEECPKFVDSEKILCFHGPCKFY